MKRLHMVPLTPEDLGINLGLRITYFGIEWQNLLCQISDACIEAARRDADLMLGAQMKPRSIAHWRPGLDELILLRGPPAGERMSWPE